MFLHWNALIPFSKTKWPCMGWFPISVLLIYLDHHSHCFDYCSFLVSLDIMYSVKPPNLFFFKIVLAVLIPFPFHLRISLSIKKENLARILIRCFKVLLWYNTRFTGSSKINVKGVICTLFTEFPSLVTSCIPIVQYQDQQIDIGTIHKVYSDFIVISTLIFVTMSVYL